MTDTREREKKVLSLDGDSSSSKGKLSLRGGGDGQVRQSFSHGRTKAVQVEVKRKKRGPEAHGSHAAGAGDKLRGGGPPALKLKKAQDEAKSETAEGKPTQAEDKARTLTEAEREARVRALKIAAAEAERKAAEEAERKAAEEERQKAAAAEAARKAAEEAEKARQPLDPEEIREREREELRKIQEADRLLREKAEAEAEERRKAAEEERKAAKAAEEERRKAAAAQKKKAETDTTRPAEPKTDTAEAQAARFAPRSGGGAPGEDEDDSAKRRRGKNTQRVRTAGEPRRRSGKLTVTQAINEDESVERTRSLASVRRAREKERRKEMSREQVKQVRDVTIPEAITVQELANRMAERGADVIKSLMKMGMMVSITQSIDADTAELIVEEFGHRSKRVSESDVELGIEGAVDRDEELRSRAPVVTVMGHVDHGKTSLLDALRQTDVVAGEAGGITQHIGAYQVMLPSGARITFLDTPGHAAFTEMRARGAHVTDVAVIVVAADDSVMPQTIEAIHHAKAASVPIIIAINKCDLPGADPMRVRQELLQHDIVVEDMGGDVLSVEVSAKQKIGLDRLEEAILLQSEILELQANPNRTGQGAVVEAKMERGRGSVATVLVQKGTLRVGDVFITGTEWGRVRALLNDRGEQVEDAGPAVPVEVLGLNGTPAAGDDFVVVESEAKAREISEYRQRKVREAAAVASKKTSLDNLFSASSKGQIKILPILIKADVHGSSEAISGALTKLAEDNEEIDVNILLSSVGAINESDINLARASGAMVVGFNVRANAQARELAKREGTEIRYYSVIYDLIDDVKAALSGMLSPVVKQNFIGYAEIRQVFNITKVGKVGGCYVTEGVVKRGAGVRLLRDNVVIHEGTLKTLKRFKDEVKEVNHGMECGMAFENYDDIKEGDVIEAYETIEEKREL